MAPARRAHDEPTYDSPSAFFEAMDYTGSTAMNPELLQYNDTSQYNMFKPNFKSTDPSFDAFLGGSGDFSGFSLDNEFWNQPSHFAAPGTINPALSPLDGNQSCDTGYVSQEGSSEKSPTGMQPMPSENSTIPAQTSNKASARGRKRSSTTSTKSNAPGAKAPARKARRSSKAMSIDMVPEGEDGLDEEKREQFLARNREAASKCRQKKKEWTQDLEQRARDLASQKQMLTTYLAMLKNELLMLKCKCLEHSDCECEGIRDYLKNTVTNMPPANAALYSKLNGKDATEISGEIARKQSSFDIDAMSPSELVSSPDSAEDGAGFMRLEAELKAMTDG